MTVSAQFFFKSGEMVQTPGFFFPAGSLPGDRGARVLMTKKQRSTITIVFSLSGVPPQTVVCATDAEYQAFETWEAIELLPPPLAPTTMRRTTFPLPEVDPKAFACISLTTNNVLVTADNTNFFTVEDCTLDSHAPGVETFRFKLGPGAATLHVQLNSARATEFQNWLKGAGVMVRVPSPTFVKNPPFSNPVAGQFDVKPTTCPECYGTGHRFGFGAPCSKGCKS